MLLLQDGCERSETMSLQARLDAIRASFADKVPDDAKAIMSRATEDLANSGILERVVEVGAKAPEFILRDSKGQPVSLSALRSEGPLVLSFFRGTW